MKKSVALILTASTLFLAGCCTTHQTARWQYQTRANLTDGQLNDLGKEGWKVVGYTKDETGQFNNSTFVLERKRQ
jgi:hypothetical protein